MRAGGVLRGRVSRPHLDELDVVRPLASLMVITTHAMQMFAYTGSVLYGAVLVESEASRHIFFFVSALVLMYQACGRSRWSAWAFWRRRFLLICVPYAIWTAIYVLLAFTGLHGDTIPSVPATALGTLTQIGLQLVTGAGHLYFIVVLMQFYLVFPVLRWVVQVTGRYGLHVPLVAVSLAAQVAVTMALHYRQVDSTVWQDINSTREITSYQFYLVTGAVIGAHLPEVRQWAGRHRKVLIALAALAVAGVEAWYVRSVRYGASPGSASDPFAPELIPSYLAGILLLSLAGAWWARRQRDGRLSRLVRTTSDDSFGVYLSHIVFLDIAATLGLGHLDSRLTWPVVVAIAVCGTWLAASLFTVVMARTPVSRWVTGRARRPVAGGPPPVGWGTVAVAGGGVMDLTDCPGEAPSVLSNRPI